MAREFVPVTEYGYSQWVYTIAIPSRELRIAESVAECLNFSFIPFVKMFTFGNLGETFVKVGPTEGAKPNDA